MGMYIGHFDFEHPLLWTVSDLFSPEECATILNSASTHEWFPATVNRAEGRAVDAKLRDSTTAVLRDSALADDLYQRVKPHVPARMTAELGNRGRVAMDVAGVHVPVRIYRYERGQQFGPHQDQCYLGPNDTRSLLTLMVYLNDDFRGGETDFPEQSRTIVPKTGMALLFQHMLLHAGKPVIEGSKYVLRSDVLYQIPPQ
jgi:predicted 2-oxoglutarate/Fe(II)-dependent dioxygenase YbiX